MTASGAHTDGGDPRARRLDRMAPRLRRRPVSTRRSRSVAVLRILLPATAAGLMAVLFAWPTLERLVTPSAAPTRPVEVVEPEEMPSAALAAWLSEMETNGGDRAAMERALSPSMGDGGPEMNGGAQILQPRYTSRGGSGNPFGVEAELAHQAVDDTGLVVLDKPTGWLSLPEERRLTMTAHRGVYDREGNSLLIDGGVTLELDDGTRLVTDAAFVRFDEGRAWSQTPVTVNGPRGTLTGAGFLVTDEGRSVVVTGPSALTLNPPASDPPAGGGPASENQP